MKTALCLALALSACTFGDNELRTRGEAAHLVLGAYCDWEERCSGDQWWQDTYGGSHDDCVTYWEVYYRPYVAWDIQSGDWSQVLECADDMEDRACGGEFPPSCMYILDL